MKSSSVSNTVTSGAGIARAANARTANDASAGKFTTKFIAPPSLIHDDARPRKPLNGASHPGTLLRAPRLERDICDEARLLEAVLRTDLASFTAKAFQTVNPTARYLDNWHVQLICEYLAACSKGEIRRLIINLPPRSLKSICVSVAWPAWLMGHAPSARIMTASYSRALSIRHALDFRAVTASPWYRSLFPGFAPASDQNEKHKLQTTARGHRIATSVGGAATGEGADILIVDDPHNPRQALSTVQRENALDWFDQTFASRLDDKKKGVMVVVMQRLHERDLTGHLLAKGGWEHLCMPAEAERRTVVDFGSVKLVREPGALLHPDREGPAEIARAKRELGAYAYAAQYQQRPAPLAGGIVDLAWFKRYGAAPANPLRIVQSWDTAFKGGALNDPSVCGTWAETETGYYLLHVARRRLEYPALKRAVKSLAATWTPDAILIEDKASGQSLIQDLRSQTRLPVIAIRPEADKLTRMSTASPAIEAGRVFLPKSAAWLDEYEAEMAVFPNGAHDDQVDMTSQFLRWATAKRRGGPRLRSL